jgi:hypothetical protein
MNAKEKKMDVEFITDRDLTYEEKGVNLFGLMLQDRVLNRNLHVGDIIGYFPANGILSKSIDEVIGDLEKKGYVNHEYADDILFYGKKET